MKTELRYLVALLSALVLIFIWEVLQLPGGPPPTQSSLIELQREARDYERACADCRHAGYEVDYYCRRQFQCFGFDRWPVEGFDGTAQRVRPEVRGAQRAHQGLPLSRGGSRSSAPFSSSCSASCYPSGCSANSTG